MAARLAKQLAALAKGFSNVATKHSAAKQLAELASDCERVALPAYKLAAQNAHGVPDAERAELARWVLSWLARAGAELAG